MGEQWLHKKIELLAAQAKGTPSSTESSSGSNPDCVCWANQPACLCTSPGSASAVDLPSSVKAAFLTLLAP
eukprot:scaffold2592_cov16-Tisochrysis_lutea.AAC.1